MEDHEPPAQPAESPQDNQPVQQQPPEFSQPVTPPADSEQITQPPKPVPAVSVPPASPQVPTVPSSSPPQQHANKLLQWLIILVLIFVGFLVVAAWYFQTQLQKSTETMVKPPTPVASASLSTTLVIGTDPTFPPMEYMQNGKMIGFDIDLANLIAKQMGIKVQFKNIVFDNLFTALDAKQINLIIAGVTITPQRQQKYDFSIPYINAGEVIITQKNNSLITSTAQLKDKKIGVQKDTTDEQEALKFTPSSDVIPYTTFVQATQALVSGQIDAIVTDLPDAQGIVASNATLKIASDPFTNEYYGIVFRKGDPMRNRINVVLNTLQSRGYLTELKHKWLY